ncbi:hypothetical protein CPT03_06130 [Pedobacter ginsengisoli]|uniref:Uncharacterized protein n=1 Tax=Pedobacter ginsengisoli TaxID=363852 RepID=A0A2D1U387_9SPHI|nr:hypothetical protein [Pedobacter ginsengisoli]ATP56066.1 hypothetical protein CPT03_06130 [Pedobacter ginsengisoli]
MKLKNKLFLSALLYLLLFLSFSSHAQNFNILVNRADSLKALKENEKAILFYNQAIDLILNNKEEVHDYKWHNVLINAGNTAWEIDKKTNNRSFLPQKYWGMAYGSHGEKLADKIIFLKDYGIKDMIIYYSYGGMMSNYNIGGCSDNITKYLLWLKDKTTYIQQFSECDSYKPIAIKASPIQEFYLVNKNKMAVEKLSRVHEMTDMPIYDLDFVTDTGTFFRTTFHQFDLDIPDSPAGSIENYQRNMTTQLSKFIPMIWQAVRNYNNTMHSGKERGLVGRF